jgi:hypothetical protein
MPLTAEGGRAFWMGPDRSGASSSLGIDGPAHKVGAVRGCAVPVGPVGGEPKAGRECR